MRRAPPRVLLLIPCVVGLVVIAVAAGWYWWPRQVAPALTPQMVRTIEQGHRRTITLIADASRRDAHTLWSRYHQRSPNGTPPENPRLLGISLANVRDDGSLPDGTYWLVYSDRVWQPSLGPDASLSGFSREIVYVDPKTLRALESVDF